MIPKRLLFLVRSILIILVLTSLLDVGYAQEEGLTLESEIDYVFGQELRFSLKVQNATDVERITLYFRPELSTELFVVNVPFETGETLSVTAAWAR